MKIHCHNDADGITSALFTWFGNPDYEIVMKREFGDTSDWENGDIMVDMRPNDPSIEGLVIDHHPGHPDERNYYLIWDVRPASYIAFKQYKDSIPKSQWWKLAIGLGGDNQLELLDAEIFDSEPQLLYKVKTYAFHHYGSWQLAYYPLYKLLSSLVNSIIRIGDFENAINLVRFAERPLDIYHSEIAQEARNKVRDEVKKVMSSCDIINLKDVHIVIFESDYKLTGYIASVVEASKDTYGSTIMAINRRDGSLSVRGDLALYIKEKLEKLPYIEIDGHPGFMGGKIKYNPYAFIDELAKLI